MTIWEKVIVNLEKGAKKITGIAALFSERVKAEIAIARLRIRLDEVRSLISQQERIIGRKLVDLRNKDEMPKSSDQLLRDEDIVAALAEITAREKDLEDIFDDIARQQSAVKQAEKAGEETAQ
jgi:hypothetical protein